MRIHTTYTEEEGKFVIQRAAELGMSASAYQRYCTLLVSRQDAGSRAPNTPNIATLSAMMLQALHNLKSGDLFIISTLFDPGTWSNLEEREKKSLAQSLKRIVRTNSNRYTIVQKLDGKVNQYKVL